MYEQPTPSPVHLRKRTKGSRSVGMMETDCLPVDVVAFTSLRFFVPSLSGTPRHDNPGPSLLDFPAPPLSLLHTREGTAACGACVRRMRNSAQKQGKQSNKSILFTMYRDDGSWRRSTHLHRNCGRGGDVFSPVLIVGTTVSAKTLVPADRYQVRLRDGGMVPCAGCVWCGTRTERSRAERC